MSPTHAPALRTPRTLRRVDLLPWLLGGLTVLAQITWVLASGAARDTLTITSVALFFLASASHALLTRGPPWTAVFFGVALGFGFAVEAVGLATGVPFGAYEYGSRLGPALLGVPLLIPLAWAMMAYPCFVVSLRATRSRVGAVVLAGVLLATWDLFLDPQMVAEGHWIFADSSPALPGSTGTPVVNHLGWLVAGLALMASAALALVKLIGPGSVDPGSGARAATPPGHPQDSESFPDRRRGLPPPNPRGGVAFPGAMLAWVYCSNVLANAVFLGRPVVALVGGIGMGIPMAITAVGVGSRASRAGSRDRGS